MVQLKMKDMAVFPKPKLIVYIGKSQKSFWTWPQPQKKNPKGPKKRKKGPKFGRIKNKKIELYFQNQSWLSKYVGPKNVFKPDPTPKIVRKGPQDSPERPKNAKSFKLGQIKKYFDL